MRLLNRSVLGAYRCGCLAAGMWREDWVIHTTGQWLININEPNVSGCVLLDDKGFTRQVLADVVGSQL